MSEQSPLSEREIEVLQQLALGASNNEIANTLVISPNTVKVHIRNIYTKLGVLSRTEATLEAVRRGLIEVAINPTLVPEPEIVPTEPEPLVRPPSSEPPPAEPVQATTIVQPTIPSIPDPITPVLTQPTNQITIPRSYALAILGVLGGLIVAVMAIGWIVVRSNITPTTQPVPTTVVSNVWQPLTALPQPTYQHTGVFLADSLLVIGGNTETGVVEQTWQLNLATGAWRELAPKPTAVAASGAVQIAGQIYVAGGRDKNGNASKSFEIFDLAQNRWQSGPAMPEARANAMVAAIDGKVYVFGGENESVIAATSFIYSPDSKSWSQGAPIPLPLRDAAIAQNGSDVVLIGGQTTTGPNLKTWRLQTGAWQALADLPAPRIDAGAVFITNQIYVVGGAEGDQPVLVLQNNLWTTTDLRTGHALSEHLVLSNARDIYSIGGWNGTNALAETRSWTPITNIFLPGVGR
ncbi:kelch repeat-containing protein [Herpetosiphon llansteffanensis]|uniref:kelch repeat-containing protein n=1 Tax=Herpetosiphon llansteffanensis TaxID=2094568 RepID=UPI000D7BECB5|nr:kelch repeat-containing protein [Herpetosiphon llansteffanensis]